jgi:hypothetical protein
MMNGDGGERQSNIEFDSVLAAAAAAVCTSRSSVRFLTLPSLVCWGLRVLGMSASQASSYRDVVQGKFACSPGRTREVDLWAWAWAKAPC